MKYRLEEKRVDESCGFPVVIWNAPKVIYEERGDTEALDVGPEALMERVTLELIETPRPWTGNEVRFIRHWLDETLEEFGQRVGVSHAAVHKWEGKADSPTAMGKGNEYAIRVEAARALLESEVIDEHEFVELSGRAVAFDPNRPPEPIELDGLDLVDDDWGDGTDRTNAATG